MKMRCRPRVALLLFLRTPESVQSSVWGLGAFTGGISGVQNVKPKNAIKKDISRYVVEKQEIYDCRDFIRHISKTFPSQANLALLIVDLQCSISLKVTWFYYRSSMYKRNINNDSVLRLVMAESRKFNIVLIGHVEPFTGKKIMYDSMYYIYFSTIQIVWSPYCSRIITKLP